MLKRISAVVLSVVLVICIFTGCTKTDANGTATLVTVDEKTQNFTFMGWKWGTKLDAFLTSQKIELNAGKLYPLSQGENALNRALAFDIEGEQAKKIGKDIDKITLTFSYLFTNSMVTGEAVKTSDIGLTSVKVFYNEARTNTVMTELNDELGDKNSQSNEYFSKKAIKDLSEETVQSATQFLGNYYEQKDIDDSINSGMTRVTVIQTSGGNPEKSVEYAGYPAAVVKYLETVK